MTSLAEEIKDQIRGSFDRIKSSVRMAARLEAFRAVYEKADRIISGHPVRVQMAIGEQVNSMLENAPGWTDGSTIWLNSDLIERDLGKQNVPLSTIVLLTKAVNYHELAHVMFSPRLRDDIVKWLIGQQSQGGPLGHLWWYAYNGLEDQRIETYFTAKYAPAGKYFEAIVLKWMVVNSAFVAESFILLHGRKFLPNNIRDAARAAFVAKYNDALASDFEKVIDDYLDLKFPGDTLRAQVTIRKYVQLMDQMRTMAPFTNHPTPTLPSVDNGGAQGPTSRNDPTVINQGASKQRDQTEAHRQKDKVLPREPVEVGIDGDDGDDEDSTDKSGDVHGDDGDVSEVDIPGDTGDMDEEGGDSDMGDGKSLSGKGNQPANSDGGSSKSSGGSQETDGGTDHGGSDGEPGQGSSQIGGNVTHEAISEVYNALDELFSDDEFMQELNDTAQTIQNVMQGDEGAAWGEHAHYKDVPVSSEAIFAANKMKLVLSRLRTELDESVSKRQMTGKLDMKRFANRNEWDVDFFQVWEPGLEEETDLEAVVMIDISYSMYSYMGITSEALWTVKRALEALDSRVTVLGFSEESFVMYQPHEKVGKTTMRLFDARSATVPDASLKEALRLFGRTNRTQKLLVAITDGDWQGSDEHQAACISGMHDLGVVTTLIGIGAAPREQDHGMQIHRHLDSIKLMPKVATDIVAEALKQLPTNLV